MRVKTPLHFHSKLKRLKALYTKFVDRVCHVGVRSSESIMEEGEEAFWLMVFAEELFD